jgi:hypothetical protein
MQRSSDASEMARQFFGFGRWGAPFWFIGPEPGKGPTELDGNAARIREWVRLGRPELCDCEEFHLAIGELHWHRQRPRLQRTWRSLMLFLMAAQGKAFDNESPRTYQRRHWGKADGETCVIELSGVASKKLTAPIDGQPFLKERIAIIRERLVLHKPALVVLYGVSRLKAFEEITGCFLRRDGVNRRGDTLFVFTGHPVAHGRKDTDWATLAQSVRSSFSGALSDCCRRSGPIEAPPCL